MQYVVERHHCLDSGVNDGLHYLSQDLNQPY